MNKDILDGIVADAIQQVEDLLIDYLGDDPSDDPTTISQKSKLFDELNHNGSIHEIIDNAVPIYDSDIEDIMYLHGNKVEAAFEDAGIRDKSDNWEAAAIYTYIEKEVMEWFYSNVEEIIQERRKK